MHRLRARPTLQAQGQVQQYELGWEVPSCRPSRMRSRGASEGGHEMTPGKTEAPSPQREPAAVNAAVVTRQHVQVTHLQHITFPLSTQSPSGYHSSMAEKKYLVLTIYRRKGLFWFSFQWVQSRSGGFKVEAAH